MTFRTQYERIRCNTCSGNEVAEIYDLIVDKKGNNRPEVVDKVYIPDQIDAHRESVDMNVILAKYANGDTDALNRRQGSYFDATGMPTTLAEMYSFVENAKSGFEQLPLAVREAYNQSFGEFIEDYGSEKMARVFEESGVIPVNHPEKKEGVESAEQKQGD